MMAKMSDCVQQARSEDITLETFKKFVSYMRGALWWVRNDLLKERQPTFNQYDPHEGHPALSLRLDPVESRLDAVPMLMGTTGGGLTLRTKSDCVVVTGLTKKDPDHKTYFGSIVEPGMYAVGELLDGVVKKNDVEIARAKGGRGMELVRKSWYECRVMLPNWDKPMVNETELAELNNFCSKHGL